MMVPGDLFPFFRQTPRRKWTVRVRGNVGTAKKSPDLVICRNFNIANENKAVRDLHFVK
jgi:hypothetical protein